MSTRQRFSALWLPVLWMGLPLWLLLGGVLDAIEKQRVEQQGQVVQGMVLTKYHQRFGKYSIKGLLISSFYEERISYRFTVQGQVLSGDSPVRGDTWRALDERGPVRVRYVPRHPTLSRVEGEPESFLVSGISIGLGAVLLVGWFWLFGSGLRDMLDKWRLSSGRVVVDGEMVKSLGTVTAVTETGMENETRWVIHYSYQDHLGQRREGHVELRREALDAIGWREGMRATVVFERDTPQESALLP